MWLALLAKRPTNWITWETFGNKPKKTRFDSCGGAWSQRGPRVEITNFAVEITNFAVETPNFAVVPRTLKIHTKSFEISFVDKKDVFVRGRSHFGEMVE